MKKKLLIGVMAFVVSVAAFAQTQAEPTATVSSSVQMVKYIAAALAVGIAAMGGAMAVAKIGSAAMGAMAEKPIFQERPCLMSALPKEFVFGDF